MVILVHASQLFSFNTVFENELFAYGKMGVQLFFIASAYTLCLSSHYREKEEKHILKFYIRRYFRIFPIYYLGIIIYFSLNYFFKTTEYYTVKNIFSNIFFIHGLVPSANNTIVPGGWSIGVEMLFYLFFPFLFDFLSSGKSILKGIGIILISQIVLFYFQRKPNFDISFYNFNILNQISVFIIGILFFLNKKYFANLKLLSIIVFILLTILAIYISANNNDYKYKGFRYAFRIIPMISALSFCFLFIVVENSRFINNAVLQKIGINSYSIYIIHFVPAFYFLPKMNGYFNFILAYLFIIGVSYFVSILLNKYIEKPFVKFGSKLINKI
ncbi:peptidoglycan/LPS O-acetylase OafA/YrhL [Chryseobacterium limigenitum]